MAAPTRSVRAFLLALAAAVAAQFAFRHAGPAFAPSPPWDGVAAYLAVVAAVLGTCSVAPTPRPLGLAATLVGSAAILTLLGVLRVGAAASLPAAGVLLALLAGGALLGAAIGGRIEVAGHLLPVAYVSSLADLFSVFTPGAPSEQLIRSEQLLALLALPWAPLGAGAHVPVLGVGDVVMSSLYLSAARHLELGLRRMLLSLAIGYLGCLAALWLAGVALPALPFLGLAVVLGVPEARAVPREDRRPAAIGAAVLTLLLLALSLR